MSLRRKIFYGFTLAVIALLIALPSTGWLVRLQLFPFASSSAMVYIGVGKPANSNAAYRKAAQHSPSDFDTQFAYALSGIGESDRVSSLEALDTRFPHNPVLLSALLRAMTAAQVRVNRTEENVLYSVDQRAKLAESSKKAAPSNPAQVARFIALAQDGEKQDPDNAFFPMMATMGYLADHQDDAATAAWVRASKMGTLNDYAVNEATARWKLQRAANNGNETGSIARMSLLAAVPFPHYACLRATVRVITAKAVLAEQAGDKETGFALRQATRLNGQHLILRSKSMIGMLVGQATVAIGAARPGGVDYQKNPYVGTDASKRWSAEKQERYKAYLQSIGHADEATAFAATMAQGDTIRKIWKDGNEETYFGFGRKTQQFFGIWCTDALLITGALFSLVFAGIFKIVHRFSPRLQNGEPLQASAKWGIANGLILPLLAASFLGMAGSSWGGMELVGFGIGVVVLVAPALLLRLTVQQLVHGFLVMLATVAALAGIVITGGIAWSLFGGITQLFGFYNESSVPSEYQELLARLAPWIVGALVISVPLGMLGLFGIFSRILKVPFAAGVTRGMRATAVPLAAVLMLIWSGMLLYTLKHERLAIAEQERIATIGETQTIAGILHRSYPK